MRKQSLRLISILFLFCAHAVFFSVAHATLFPLRNNPNIEVIYLEDSQVDLAVRDKLLSEAKHSIDMVSFAHSADEIGLPVVDALRAALNRGVAVRTAFDLTGNKIEGDSTRHISQLLTDSSLKRQAEVIGLSPIQKLKNRLFLDDFIHEKIMIIDGGTPDVKIVVGGRNLGKFLPDFGDSAYLLRPVDPSKPWAGTDIEKFYEQLWSFLQTAFKKSPVTRAPKKALKKLAQHPKVTIENEAQAEKYRMISGLIDSKPVKNQPLLSFQFRPQTFQLASNDLLANASSDKAGFNVKKREHLANDILELLHSRIPYANNILHSGYAVGLPEPLASDFKAHVESGKGLQIVTNGREAFHSITKPKTFSRAMGNSATDYTLKNLIPLLEAGEKAHANISVNMLRGVAPGSELGAEELPEYYKYLHRKLLIMDDEVATGSDNWTQSSARKNDEIVIVMKDPRMAEYLRGQVNREVKAFYRPVTLDDAKAELDDRSLIDKSVSKCLQEVIRRTF